MNLSQTIYISQLYGGGPGSGCHGPSCGRPATKERVLSDRARRALESWKPFTKDKWFRARQNEIRLAGALGGQVGALGRTQTSEFDVMVGRRHAIEVKTIIDPDANDKITQHPSGLLRKAQYASENRIKHTWMVAFDERDPKDVKIYIKPGVGSYRLSSMQKVADLQELKKVIGRK